MPPANSHDPSKEGLLSAHARRRDSSSSYGHGSDDDSDIDASDYLHGVPFRRNADDKSRVFSTESSSARKPSFLERCIIPFRNRLNLKTRRSRCCLLIGTIALIWIVFAALAGTLWHKFQEEPPYGQSPPWYPSPRGGTSAKWAESYAKAAEMVRRMTLPEKVNITTGTGWQMGLSVGTTGPALGVGFPALQLQDGPLGIRFADNITAFPAGVTVAATFNKQLFYARGKAHAVEARQKGINVLLSPCVGPLGKFPAGGRAFEAFGSDPYLQGIAGAETIKGIQSEGVMATVKHFVGNEQEHFRQPWEWGLPHALSTRIEDRILHELYAWPFGDAVKAGVASVMCSYNQVNNSYACGNSKLLNGILKDEMGFQGFVMSDWLAQRSGVGTALAGLDMSMPGDGLRWANGDSLWGPELTKAVLNGTVPMERLNDMVTRIVAAWYQMGQDDETKWPRNGRPNFSSWTNDKMGVLSPGSPSPQEEVEVNQFVNVQSNHSLIAREVAAEGVVLLKNTDDILPLSRDGTSPSSKYPSRRDAGGDKKLNIGVFGEDAGPAPNGPNGCKDRACNEGTLGSGWGSGAVEFPYLTTPIEALRKEFDDEKVLVHEHLSNKLASPSAKGSAGPVAPEDMDICLVFANADSGEGFVKWEGVSGDRPDLYLQKGGDNLIMGVADRCGGPVIVVIHSVGPVLLEKWINHDKVKAVLFAMLPGQDSGTSLADIIFGDTNPSGHLPFTIGKSLDDYGPGAKVMYTPNKLPIPQQDFSDSDLYIDYRHFDKRGIAPRYEFGFGLSYTTFELADLKIKTVRERTSPLPSPRPQNPVVEPPLYRPEIPNKEEAYWPDGLRKLEKYIYPYISPSDDTSAGGSYPFPDGYSDTVLPSQLSPAGGEEGGNPDLWETYVTVSVNVTNTGDRAGAAVPQLYLGYYPFFHEWGAQLDLPVRVLRGFEKIYLKEGETQRVEFNLTRRDLSYWDIFQQNWVMLQKEGAESKDPRYKISVGFSSRDLRLKGSL